MADCRHLGRYRCQSAQPARNSVPSSSYQAVSLAGLGRAGERAPQRGGAHLTNDLQTAWRGRSLRVAAGGRRHQERGGGGGRRRLAAGNGQSSGAHGGWPRGAAPVGARRGVRLAAGHASGVAGCRRARTGRRPGTGMPSPGGDAGPGTGAVPGGIRPRRAGLARSGAVPAGRLRRGRPTHPVRRAQLLQGAAHGARLRRRRGGPDSCGIPGPAL